MRPQSPIKKIAIRYKTELCKNWQSGHCEFGEKCAFAHGRLDMRSKSSFRTKKCRQFFESGFCMYGEKCMFLHTRASQSPPKPRLPIFQKICDLTLIDTS